MEEDDEILDLFLEESLEHLEGVESDLLEIEKAGADIDVDQVNKVFRAMHTIKGGSSFFGLDKVKDLTHIAENILDKMRKWKLVPTPDIVQCLLEVIDHISEMINNPHEMDSYDISDSLAKLEAIQNGGDQVVEDDENEIEFKTSSGELVFTAKTQDLMDCENHLKGGPNLYLLTYDLLKDVESKGRNPQGIITELIQLCYIIDSKVNYENVPDLENFGKAPLPFYVLVSTVLEPDMVFEFFDLEHGSISIYDINGKMVGEMVEQDVAHEEVPKEDLVSNFELGDLNEALEDAAKSMTEKDPQKAKEGIANHQSVQIAGDGVEKMSEPKSQELVSVPAKATPSTKTAEPAKATQSEVKPKANTPVKKTAAKSKKSGSSENLRVNISLLENLMSLAGELVLARNQLLQASEEEELVMMKQASQQINMVTSQLQEAIMKTRMQPVGSVFNKFHRIVRDLCGELGKDIELVTEGENVEMDKTIIESIGDPLTHIIRNSMDHGLEPPDERIAAGKNGKGTLSIKAYHEAGKVIIQIDDDGRGVNVKKVSEKAFEAGLVTEQMLEKMTEKEIVNLIFMPGFSTADEVTEISGRGVGMDVVLTNLKALGGIVDLTSRSGQGTSIKISLPLTLAIMPSLLVSLNERTYAVPQVNLLQIVRVQAEEVSEKIQHVGDSLVLRFMDELIKVVRGVDFLKEDTEPLNFDNPNYGFVNPLHILIVAAGELKYGIVVDQTLDSPEIVVKPFGRHLKPLKIYAGATILGNGDIAPIFDIVGIASEMNISQIDQHRSESEEDVDKNAGELQKLLIVKSGEVDRLAIPLNNIIRIERVPAEKVRNVGSQMTYEFMGKSIALFKVDEVADIDEAKVEGQCSIIIFEALNRHLGLFVNEVVDSVEIVVEFDETTHKQPGIFGSAYINDQLTLLVDLFGIVEAKKPHWIQKSGITVSENDKDHLILVVDDSKFFVKQISGFLEDVGYKTVTAMDGEQGLEVLRSRDDISLVLSDIEMPVMDGWEFVKAIRSDANLKDMPVIAVTSVAGDHAREKGMSLGMNEYLVKLDKEEILHTLKRYLYDKVPV